MVHLDSSRLKLAESVFQAVVALPPAERNSAIGLRCGTDGELRSIVERLVEGDEQAASSSVNLAAFRPASVPVSAGLPARIGRYRIVREIGHGGMGVVYEAVQESPRRAVALKVIRFALPGPELVRRFEFEAEILGRLRHPAISQVYEAGSGEVHPQSGACSQVPFVAMELIRGEPLIEFATRRRLSIRQRVELAARVCDAVTYAHQQGVIHRDLKPANIVVESNDDDGINGSKEQEIKRSEEQRPHPTSIPRSLDPSIPSSAQPKILDFGVARLLDRASEAGAAQTVFTGAGQSATEAGHSATKAGHSATKAGQLVGTLAYMSPEQVRGNPDQIDTRTDIYSLGVILYELLSGRQPYDLSNLPLPEASQEICEREPPRMSSFNRALRGDMDTIVAKALAKDKTRRYQSAAELGADLYRHLRHEPVLARPPRALYQLARFARRNRGLVGGAAIALAALIMGTIASTVFAWRASQQAERAAGNESRALAAAARADAVVQVLLDVVRSPDPDLVRGPNFTVRELLDEISAQVDEQFRHQPETAAAIHATVGETYHAIGLFERARPHLQAALDIRLRLSGENHADVAESQVALAALLAAFSESDAATALLEQALETRQQLLGPEHPQVADILAHLSDLRSDERLYDEAEQLSRDALRIYRSDAGDNARGIGNCLDQLGYIARARKKYTEAEEYFRAELEHNRSSFGDRHPKVFLSMKSLAALLRIRKQYDESQALYLEALAGVRELLGPDHPHVANVLNSIANLRWKQGRLDESEDLFRQALETYRKNYSGDSVGIAVCLANHARMLADKREFARAAQLAGEALEMRRRLHPESHGNITELIPEVARFLAAAGDLATAAELSRDGIRRVRTLENRWLLGRRLTDFGRLLTAHGSPIEPGLPLLNEAESALLEAHGLALPDFGESNWRTRWVASSLGQLYQKWHHPKLAARWRAASRPPPAAAAAAKSAADVSSDADD